jgi:hypothetical protein
VGISRDSSIVTAIFIRSPSFAERASLRAVLRRLSKTSFAKVFGAARRRLDPLSLFRSPRGLVRVRKARFWGESWEIEWTTPLQRSSRRSTSVLAIRTPNSPEIHRVIHRLWSKVRL